MGGHDPDEVSWVALDEPHRACCFGQNPLIVSEAPLLLSPVSLTLRKQAR